MKKFSNAFQLLLKQTYLLKLKKTFLPYENSIEDTRIVINVYTGKTEVADTDLLIYNDLRLYKNLLGKIKELFI